MAEIRVEIPDELESEFKTMSRAGLSIFMSKVLKDKLSQVIRIKKILSKSKLTQKQADELSKKISESLSRRYAKLFLKG